MIQNDQLDMSARMKLKPGHESRDEDDDGTTNLLEMMISSFIKISNRKESYPTSSIPNDPLIRLFQHYFYQVLLADARNHGGEFLRCYSCYWH